MARGYSSGQGYDYLEAYVAGTKNVPIRALGIHFYFGEDGQDLTPFMDRACEIYERYRPEPCNLWITEYGIHNQEEPYQTFLDWTLQIHRHPNVERYFGYTTSTGEAAITFLDNNGRITPVGEAWIASYWILKGE